jgi:L-alanine-DL-glutamate epimerase-like enolase superfamily enzyme
MRIDEVDFFYAAMPEVTLEADGSQDALLVRVRAGDVEGWGECEASPLVSVAAFVTPRSHGVCQPVAASVLGERLDSPADIARIAALVQRSSMDLLQAAHTFSGIEIALWDALGKALDEPVWSLLGYDRSLPKTPYASLLFGETPEDTYRQGRSAVGRGFRAVKFGWGAFGLDLAADADHLHAARESIGEDALLLVDAGQVWVDDVEAAAARIPTLEAVRTTWLEEPFLADAYDEHARLAARCRSLRIAGGEGAHTPQMAVNLMRYGRIGYVQVDTGRIGGIGAAKSVADVAAATGSARFVNHTFTSHLALSASLQPFAGLEGHDICEYPAQPKPLADAITADVIPLDADGRIAAPDAPGLGMTVDEVALEPYRRTIRIEVDGLVLYDDADVPAPLPTGGMA